LTGELADDLVDDDKAVRFVVRERLEQDAVDDGEYGCRRPDRQRKRENDDRGIAPIAEEPAQDVSQVEDHVGLDGTHTSSVRQLCKIQLTTVVIS
jgi:hypothetical protein